MCIRIDQGLVCLQVSVVSDKPLAGNMASSWVGAAKSLYHTEQAAAALVTETAGDTSMPSNKHAVLYSAHTVVVVAGFAVPHHIHLLSSISDTAAQIKPPFHGSWQQRALNSTSTRINKATVSPLGIRMLSKRHPLHCA